MEHMQLPPAKNNGFMLIELSIALVVIGLIVGGVLVGQDLINAAAVRAQISQIEKYNTAVNTFREKYGYLWRIENSSVRELLVVLIALGCESAPLSRSL